MTCLEKYCNLIGLNFAERTVMSTGVCFDLKRPLIGRETFLQFDVTNKHGTLAVSAKFWLARVTFLTRIPHFH